MTKAIMNPLCPDMSDKDYERLVGDLIEEKLIKEPGGARSFFRYWVEGNFYILEKLEQVQLKRRSPQNWEGASGYGHQIDESFSTDDESVIVLVECKHWAECVDIPAFSTFLVRVIDIAKKDPNRVVLGILVTTQGPQGKFGPAWQDAQDCIGKLRTYFANIGYPIAFQVVADVVLRG